MSNPNIFAVLIPCDKNNLARAAFRLPENVHGYCKAAEGSAQGIAEEPTIDSREPTPAPGSSPEQSNYNSADRILLRLDKPPKDPTGDGNLAPIRASVITSSGIEGSRASAVASSVLPSPSRSG
jgi:hypothetical protein